MTWVVVRLNFKYDARNGMAVSVELRSIMAKASSEDHVLRRMLKTPPKPFIPQAEKKLSPAKAKAKKG